MGRETGISWTDATWNPIRGCSRVSEGCRNCYAEHIAYRFSGPGQPYEGLVQVDMHKSGMIVRVPQWNGQIRFVEEHLLDPLKWKKPQRIFVNSMSDLFHENVTDEMRDTIFAVMALCPQHTFQVLTKRPERMLAYFNRPDRSNFSKILTNPCAWYVWAELTKIQAVAKRPIPSEAFSWTEFDAVDTVKGWPLPNVWLGVSVENQKTADERIPLLLQTPAAVRFISAEPLLGLIDLEGIIGKLPEDEDGAPYPGEIDWVIVGGESGPKARPMHPDWARSLRDQCKAAGVPFFFKQWGEYKQATEPVEGFSRSTGNFETVAASHAFLRVGTKAAGHLLDGFEHHEFPA